MDYRIYCKFCIARILTSPILDDKMKKIELIVKEEKAMIEYGSEAYSAMLGSINENVFCYAKTCISQCAGCMCNCRCSCSGGRLSEFEWEVM